MTVLIQDTEKTLAEVADIAAAGEEVLLVRDGKTVARVMADPEQLADKREVGVRGFGFLKDKGFVVPDDIKTPFKDEIEAMFYGEHE
jgi:antitoxin (DNA-binding transcriptional repressor) of toxin-antitoxin stability system